MRIKVFFSTPFDCRWCGVATNENDDDDDIVIF